MLVLYLLQANDISASLIQHETMMNSKSKSQSPSLVYLCLIEESTRTACTQSVSNVLMLLSPCHGQSIEQKGLRKNISLENAVCKMSWWHVNLELYTSNTRLSYPV